MKHNSSILGLARGEAKIISYSTVWPDLFNNEAGRLIELFEDRITINIEHIGSTSVPGLSAKPVLDLMLGINWGDFDLVKSYLSKSDYTYKGTPHSENDHVFLRGTELRTHALHVVEIDSKVWQQKIYFRDRLRADLKLSKSYEELKTNLVKKYGRDRKAYTSGKAKFINNVLKKLGQPTGAMTL